MSEIGEEPGYIEKREYERVTKLFKVDFREVSEDLFRHLMEEGEFEEAPIMELADEEAVETSTTDVSEGGLGLQGDLRLRGNRPLKVGKRLLVECYLPEESIPVRALATVMWVKPGNKPEAGLMFMGISDGDLLKIKNSLGESKKD